VATPNHKGNGEGKNAENAYPTQANNIHWLMSYKPGQLLFYRSCSLWH